MTGEQNILPGMGRPVPEWVPERWRGALAGKAVSFRLPRQVRLRMRMPEFVKGSEWARLYRRVTDGPHVGPWRHEYAPHTVKITAGG